MKKHNFDDLAVMSDDNLHNLFMRTRSDLRRSQREKRDSFDHEINLCYIQRELDIRESRRVATQTYVTKNQKRSASA